MIPLEWFINNLDKPFAFARYGDGEWNCILGMVGENCDHHPYSPELASDLRWTLIDFADSERYLYAMGPKATRNDGIGPQVKEWLAHNAPALSWVSSETLLEASLRGRLSPFVDALKARHVMIVGPVYLRLLPFPNLTLIEVPVLNCYTEKDRIESEITTHAAQADVILLSAGMLTKVLIHDLYSMIGKTMIDCGSLWDVYCGIDSRRYARKMTTKQKKRLAKANGLA